MYLVWANMVAVRLQGRLITLRRPSELPVRIVISAKGSFASTVTTRKAHMNYALVSCSIVLNRPLAGLQVLRKQGFLSCFHDSVNIVVESFGF
jgi:hypothetical protein